MLANLFIELCHREFIISGWQNYVSHCRHVCLWKERCCRTSTRPRGWYEHDCHVHVPESSHFYEPIPSHEKAPLSGGWFAFILGKCESGSRGGGNNGNNADCPCLMHRCQNTAIIKKRQVSSIHT